MRDIAFVTAIWARTIKEKERITSTLKSLDALNYPIVAVERIDTEYPLTELKGLPNMVYSTATNFAAQRTSGYIQAAKLGKNLFWLESDKKEFIEKWVPELIKESLAAPRAFIVPYPDAESFSGYPPFQRRIENALNVLLGGFIPGEHHFTYGPMIFPAELVSYVEKDLKECGWGVNAGLAAMAAAKGIPFRYVQIKIAHDSDEGEEGESLRRYRLQQVIGYVQALEIVSRVIERREL